MEKNIWIAPLIILGLGAVTFLILGVGWLVEDLSSKWQQKRRSIK